jgi:hypothetical protein
MNIFNVSIKVFRIAYHEYFIGNANKNHTNILTILFPD